MHARARTTLTHALSLSLSPHLHAPTCVCPAWTCPSSNEGHLHLPLVQVQGGPNQRRHQASTQPAKVPTVPQTGFQIASQLAQGSLKNTRSTKERRAGEEIYRGTGGGKDDVAYEHLVQTRAVNLVCVVRGTWCVVLGAWFSYNDNGGICVMTLLVDCIFCFLSMKSLTSRPPIYPSLGVACPAHSCHAA